MTHSDAGATLAPNVSQVSGKALHLLKNSLVWDNLLPWVPGLNLEEMDTLLPRFKQAGVNFISLTLAGGAGIGSSLVDVIRLIARVRREIEERSDWLVLAGSVAAIRKAQKENKLAVNFNFQETLPFESSLDLIRLYYELGVKQALLAYNQKNLVGDGCAERTDAGLSRLGVEVVKRMNQVGMLVDGSHSGYRTTLDAMDVCVGPFIFSHSNPYAIYPHYRNIKDDQIKACARTGGVIGINGVGTFVGDARASTPAVFRCLDYIVELVGPQYVGFGLDYVRDLQAVYKWADTATLAWPKNEAGDVGRHQFAGPEQLIELVQMMLEHGYPDDAVVGILGENWARVCAAVWK